jgi:Flp pilus assembly protein TadD
MPTYAVPRCAANRDRRSILGVVALALAASLGGCMTDKEATGSIGMSALPATDAGLRDFAATWGRRHDADPGDVNASINYARALRGLAQYAQATAILEAAAIKHPYDRAVLAAYGKALADAGRPREAQEVLSRAHTPDKPDWSVLSAQGSVSDQLGDHAAAVNYYEAALKIRPGEPSVMSNLGLSYALARQLPQAENALRIAAADARADMRVRQNYALVLSLEGKFRQAEAIAATDLSPADAGASVDAIRQMIARSETWRSIQKAGTAKAARVPGRPGAMPAEPPPG